MLRTFLKRTSVRAPQLPTQALKRGYAVNLKDTLSTKLTDHAAKVKAFRKEHGNKVLCEATIDMAYTGMRGNRSLVTETSQLDAEEGIRFRGYSIPECQELLPRAPNGQEPLPEGMLYLLLTGEIPTEEDVAALTAEMHKRSQVSEETLKIIDSLPKDLHPMSQMITAITLLQKESKFAAAYRNGCAKSEYWEHTYEDVLDLLAKLPYVSARIYRNIFHNGEHLEDDKSLDWGANYAKMMGFQGDTVYDLFRLYLTIHTDHEGGNVSAHTTHLVGSALSDPYLSLAAGMAGLAGPLHGLANQEVLRWLKEIKGDLEKKGRTISKEHLTEEIWETLNEGRVVPGFGHAVLRKTDPRYMCQREFALKHMKDDELFKLVDIIYQIVPGILTEQGKTKNPFPNVDAHSGCLLQHYGIVEEDYYTVMFGVSRAIGVLASLTWDRGLGMPIERPKSFTSEALFKMAPTLPEKSS